MTSLANPVESRLFRAYWDDGLLDLFFGLGVVAIGILWSFKLVAIGALVPAVLTPFWTPLRRRLIEPRAGVVEFTDDRTAHNRAMLLGACWLGVGMFVSFVAFYVLSAPRGGGLVSTFIAAVPAWLLGLLAALLGAGLRLSRFALYATFFLASGLAITVTGSEPEVAMIAAGLLTACGGLLVLVRFLRLAADGGGGS